MFSYKLFTIVIYEVP